MNVRDLDSQLLSALTLLNSVVEAREEKDLGALRGDGDDSLR